MYSLPLLMLSLLAQHNLLALAIPASTATAPAATAIPLAATSNPLTNRTELKAAEVVDYLIPGTT